MNKIWSVSANAIGKIKDAANAVLNAVKSGLEYIADTVRGLIVSAISTGMNALIKGILLLITTLDNSLTYVENQGVSGVDSGNNHDIYVGSSSSGNNLQIQINGVTIQISNLISSNPNYETLSITQPWEISLITIVTELLMVGSAYLSGNLIKTGSIGKGQLLFSGSLIASTLIEIMSMINFANNDQSVGKKDSIFLFENILAFSFGQFLGTLMWLAKNDDSDFDAALKDAIDSGSANMFDFFHNLISTGWKEVSFGKEISSLFYYIAASMGLLSFFGSSFDLSMTSMASNTVFVLLGLTFGALKSNLLASNAGSQADKNAEASYKLEAPDKYVRALRFEAKNRDIKAINLVYFSLIQYLTMFIFSGIKLAQLWSN